MLTIFADMVCTRIKAPHLKLLRQSGEMWRLLVISVAVSSVICASIPKGLSPIYDPRIVGGKKINIEEVPYMVAVVYYGAQYCGGTIITENIIMTAAHCTPGITERRTKIRVGTTSRTTGGKLLPIRKILAHENFKGVASGFDVALIWLESPLVITNAVKPFPLPYQDETVQDGALALVTGWGTLSQAGLSPDHLMGVKVPVINRERCRIQFQGYINQDMICAGYKEGGKDACQMDSGGPMVINSKVMGIVSFGSGCARPDLPGVYTNVAHFKNWISDKISKNL